MVPMIVVANKYSLLVLSEIRNSRAKFGIASPSLRQVIKGAGFVIIELSFHGIFTFRKMRKKLPTCPAQSVSHVSGHSLQRYRNASLGVWLIKDPFFSI